jgi:hypothetical protein
MFPEKLCICICRKLAKTGQSELGMGGANGLLSSQLEMGVLNEATSYSTTSENPIQCNKPELLIT